MAADAILKIKETEDKGAELIREAGEEARRIAADSAKTLVEKKNAVLQKANGIRDEIIGLAVKKAGEDCKELERQGLSEREAILNPGGERIEKAVRFIVERIVSV